MRKLGKLSHAQRERLAFIDFCLTYFGEISRADLIAKFQTGLAAATRDFSAYKELAPDNMELVHQTKLYVRKETFVPIFEHASQTVLAGLSQGFGDGLITSHKLSSACEEQKMLIEPSTSSLSVIMRAITAQKCLQVTYVSLRSGTKTRTIVPHSLANSGKRWHLRAFDRDSNTFRDFVITRFLELTVLEEPVEAYESKSADKQWNRIVDLTLIPHPKAQFSQAIELDYGMLKGELKVEVRAALAGYLLNYWMVDCSESAELNPEQYHLALKYTQAIFGIENSRLAPGYKEVS
ncbi:TPA: WYL domain-containing protein [Vibrio parahaemolyticus]|uniref:WYL domain-containing protein n=1 Tax=Vibrio parahaemolyticus TaxID=670 RepID=UPI0004086FBD|nr:WYL domain-containing protein [Vibrio parahaemolyticus]EGR1144251.1 WYL domain-containing protein [Vibrio parahaemolyticus]EGR3302277.1 WYL domain-containing protein [Vibrio parahaemolyticus]EGR3304636.1 WYL domain-containing protein [Vibrio parahaemolyticus]EGR3317729.1 WYL domain-containing protein [Vibrio parahaemolyticus]EIS4855653.1 WYL domain-containing protein [Vibrio parahaemolyticus]